MHRKLCWLNITKILCFSPNPFIHYAFISALTQNTALMQCAHCPCLVPLSTREREKIHFSHTSGKCFLKIDLSLAICASNILLTAAQIKKLKRNSSLCSTCSTGILLTSSNFYFYFSVGNPTNLEFMIREMTFNLSKT